MPGVFQNCYQNREAKITKSFCSGIINISYSMVLHIILADILLIARIFPRPSGARKNTTQLAKYPRVLYVKPSNKIYVSNSHFKTVCGARVENLVVQ